jgi:hypothetical protein
MEEREIEGRPPMSHFFLGLLILPGWKQLSTGGILPGYLAIAPAALRVSFTGSLCWPCSRKRHLLSGIFLPNGKHISNRGTHSSRLCLSKRPTKAPNFTPAP